MLLHPFVRTPLPISAQEHYDWAATVQRAMFSAADRETTVSSTQPRPRSADDVVSAAGAAAAAAAATTTTPTTTTTTPTATTPSFVTVLNGMDTT